MWSKLLKMKRTGRCALSFLRTERQSMAKRSKPSSSLARCSTMQRRGLSSHRGSCTFLSAMRCTTPLSHRKGESSTSAPTSQAQALENMSAQRLPMLRPHSVTRPTRTCRRTSSSMSRMSNTSLTPQLSCPGSLLPQPSRSKAARLQPNWGTSSARGRASSLEPPLPWRYRMVSAASACGQWKRKPSRRLPLRLSTVRSSRATLCSPTCRSLGPSAPILHRICAGEMMFRQAYSNKFISQIQIRAYQQSIQQSRIGFTRRSSGELSEGLWLGHLRVKGEILRKIIMRFRRCISVNNMTSVRKVGVDTSVTHYFAPDSPYNVTGTKGKAAARSQVHMHKIDAVGRYYGINHPILSASKKRLIEEKLKLDEQVRKELDNRQRDENLFAKFHRNPFSITQNLAPSPNDLFEEEQRKKRRGKAMNDRHFNQTTKLTVVEAVNEMTHTDFFRGTSPLRRNASYSKIASTMMKSISESHLRRPVKAKRQVDVVGGGRELSLQEIVGMEDENFYQARQGRINIFQVMRGTHKPFLTSKCLDKVYFNHSHLVERIDTLKFPLLREISRVGRDLTMEGPSKRYNRIDFIHSNEMAVKYGDIRLSDLLSIASGRFTPEIAYTAVTQGDVRKDFSPASSQVSQAEILYNSRARHKQFNCQNPQQPRHEIEAYRFIENTPEEAKFDRFCGRIKDTIRRDAELRTHLVKHTIQDTRMHNKIAVTVQENLSYLANVNRRKGTSTDRLISHNKLHKNRKETLQIRHLLQSIQLKNREEDKIKQLINS